MNPKLEAYAAETYAEANIKANEAEAIAEDSRAIADEAEAYAEADAKTAIAARAYATEIYTVVAPTKAEA